MTLPVFTGLVQAAGRIEARAARGPGFRLRIGTDLPGLELGESINVNGACLTVAKADPHWFEADVSAETANRTTLGRLPVGTWVNLERALRLSERLGGHLVSGHVDAVIRVRELIEMGDARRLECEVCAELARFVAPQGSLALDGVSLTVNQAGPDSFQLMLIPETLARTTLVRLEPGQEVNLEVDVIARYVVHWLERARGQSLGTSPDTLAASPEQISDERLLRALRRSGLM